MSKPRKRTNKATTPRKQRRPRILVLEGLSGAMFALQRQGATVVSVSPRDVAGVEKALAAKFDGLLLTGGGDVDPRLYGEQPHKKVYGVSETRDYTEWTALDRAAELGVPVMGICRGSQLMAVHNGGKLKQHIGGHRGVDHLVFSEPGSLFRRVVGKAMMSVSLHHQVVLRHGDGWRVGARDRLGNIESVESRDGRCLGVQFHPEMDHYRNEGSRALFRWLVVEASKRAGIKAPEPDLTRSREPIVLPRKPKRPAQLSFPADPGSNAPTRRKPVQKGVKVTWLCKHCGLRFDDKQDREDHEHWLHGNPTIRTTEPPPGHPDWMDELPIQRMQDVLDQLPGHDDDAPPF